MAADIVSREKRSQMMSGIRGKNTKPELLVRRLLHARGFRYRLHSKKLAGKPDIYLAKYSAAVFINGCFWHAHSCHLFKIPSSRADFWKNKFAVNTVRDARNHSDLLVSGVRVAVVWECAVKGRSDDAINATIESLSTWLASDAERADISLDGMVSS